MAEELGLSQQTTSHHLGVLRRAGLAAGHPVHGEFPHLEPPHRAVVS